MCNLNKTIITVCVRCINFVYIYSLTYTTGSDKPAPSDLMKVSSLFEACWYNIGLNLLDKEDAHELDLMKYDRKKGNTSKCCREMMKLWLRKQPNASWDQLVGALRSENVKLNDVASKIERKFKSAKGNIQCGCTVSSQAVKMGASFNSLGSPKARL